MICVVHSVTAFDGNPVIDNKYARVNNIKNCVRACAIEAAGNSTGTINLQSTKYSNEPIQTLID